MFVRPLQDKKLSYDIPRLSLFSPEPVDVRDDDDEDLDKIATVERPPSPLEEAIIKPPNEFDDYADIIKERIKPDPKFVKLTVEQQEALVSIILSEVMSNWADMCEVIQYPNLDYHQNQKLHVLIFIRVVEICQHLFSKYIDLISKFNARKVFTHEANISRINSCLITEAYQLLNVHRLRQRILSNLKTFKNIKPGSQKITRNVIATKEDFIKYFDSIVLHESELLEQFSNLDLIKRPIKPRKEPMPNKPLLKRKNLDSFARKKEESVEEEVEPTSDELAESIDKRKVDLEYLLSDLRISEKKSFKDENDDLAAVLQATAKKEQCRTVEISRVSSAESTELPVTGNLPIQSATVTHVMPDKTIVRTNDLRVTERNTLCEMVINVSPCIYNELKNEVTEKDIAFMDRNLFLGKEITEVYKEIYKTITQNHSKLISNMDDACPKLSSPSEIYNSGTLKRKRVKHRRLNTSIRKCHVPPWEGVGRENWEYTGYHHSNVALSDAGSQSTLSNSLLKLNLMHDTTATSLDKSTTRNKDSKSYANWLHWWKSVCTGEDYQKYLSTKNLDYLALIFHIYDSEEEFNSEDERDLQLEEELKKEQRRREEKLNAMLKEKNKFEKGYWNTNAIVMGGLGNNPDLDSDEESEEPKRLTLKLNHVLVAPSQPLIPVRETTSSLSNATKKSIHSKLTKSTVDAATSKVNLDMLQKRLVELWDSLDMREEDKIDLTVKYCHQNASQLQNVISLWEQVCESILSRERIVEEIELFEKEGSDPKRLFGRNFERLTEEKQRTGLYNRLRHCERRVDTHMTDIEQQLGDEVTYQGRPYRDKMSRDLTEMLYWLQQERRSSALQRGGMIMLDLPRTP